MKKETNPKRYVRIQALQAVYAKITTQYIDPFAVFLGAGASAMRWLAIIPSLAMLISEAIGAAMARRWLPVRIILFSGSVEKMMWILIAVMPAFFIASPSLALSALFILYFIQKMFEALRDPSEVSFTASLVKSRNRGVFFSKVNKVVGLAGIMTVLSGSVYFWLVGDKSWGAYALLMIIGAVIGYMTLWQWVEMDYNRKPIQPDYKMSNFLTFEKAHGSFCIKSGFFYFAVAIGSPFFVLHFLKVLAVPLYIYLAAELLRVLTQFVVYRRIGKLADKYGDRPMLVLGALGTSLAMFALFFIDKSNVWMIWPLHVLLGVAWAATDLSMYNFLLDLSDHGARPLRTAQQRIVISGAQVVGPFIGYWLTTIAFGPFVGLATAFLGSAVLRLLAAVWFSTMPEPRATRPYSAHYVFGQIMSKSLVNFHKHTHIHSRNFK